MKGVATLEQSGDFRPLPFHKSAETKMAELDPKYDKMVDEAFKNSPSHVGPSALPGQDGILRRCARLAPVPYSLLR